MIPRILLDTNCLLVVVPKRSPFRWIYDDNKFVDAYVASNADVIVTNDRHFKILASIKFPPVNIRKITEF